MLLPPSVHLLFQGDGVIVGDLLQPAGQLEFLFCSILRGL